MPERVRYEYHRLNQPPATYEQLLVLDRPDVKVLLQDVYDGPDLTVGSTVIHERGAPMIWFVFPEKWYDIGRFHRLDGAFTGWYTNLTRPVEIVGNRWRASDLLLDLWMPVTGGAIWLDEDDLERATKERAIDRATRQRVDNERALIELQLRLDTWPPQVTRDIDLSRIRQIQQT